MIPSDYDGTPETQASALDGYLFIDVPQEECIRRSQNRKVDPSTGIVYHMEDNPPQD